METREPYYEWCLLKDGDVASIKITVKLNEKSPNMYHPLDYAKAARLFADEADRVSEQSGGAFGPYENEINFGI